MYKFLFAITVCSFTIIQSSAALAAKIKISVVSEEISLKPMVTPIEPTSELQTKWQNGTLIIDLDFSKSEIKKTILLQLTTDLPTNYKFEDMKLDLPFTKKLSTIEVQLAPTTVIGSAREVRKHYATDVADAEAFASSELPKFYQEVRASALARMERLNENWLDLSDADVQSVYVYLVTVRELNSRTFIAPPDDINDALNWMHSAIKQKPKRVESAVVKLTHAEQVIIQVKQSEGSRFNHLWEALINMDQNCETKYPLLLAYKKALFAIPDGDRLETILKHVRVYKGNVLSGLAQCLSYNIRCKRNLVKDPTMRITELVEELENELNNTERKTPLHDEINSARKSLYGLKADITRGNPMVCE